jgi:Icc-related predicted phosphoesterase
MDEVVDRWAELDEEHIENFFFLDDTFVELDGIIFVGGTLWTDMNKQAPEVKSTAQYSMNDFRCIDIAPAHTMGWTGKAKTNSIAFTVEHSIEYHHDTLRFIKLILSKYPEKKVVVVTHHAPSSVCLQLERYGVNNLLNYAYYSNLEYLMDKNTQLVAWISGHTHHSVDMDVYGTQMVSNCRGYVGHELNPLFDDNASINV